MRTKKVLALFIVVAIMVCSVQMAFAETTDDIATIAQQLVSLYLDSSPSADSSASSATMYEKIPAYSFQNGNLEIIDNTDYYPVAMNNSTIGIFIISRDGTGSEVCSFSSEFANELTDFSIDNEQVCIVFDEMKMYLQGVDLWEKVYDSHGYSLEPDNEVQALSAITFETAEIDTQGLDFYNATAPDNVATLQIQRNHTRARTQLNLELWNQMSSSSTNSTKLLRSGHRDCQSWPQSNCL